MLTLLVLVESVAMNLGKSQVSSRMFFGPSLAEEAVVLEKTLDP